MNNPNQHIAVLVFTRTKKHEAVQKALLPSCDRHKNGKIIERLIDHTIDTVKASKLPYFIIDSENQIGNNFGERLSHAISYVFDQGYEGVIAIGNDCPNLSAEDLIIAADNLMKGVSTLGPSEDGGIYLMTASKASFNASELNILSWQSNRLFEELYPYLIACNQEISVLGKKQDLDAFLDLMAYLKAFPENEFSLLIKIILNRHNRKDSKTLEISFIPLFSWHNFGLRAPPLAA